MPKRSKKTHYAVRHGRKPGIYLTWDECKAQTDGYPASRFKGFSSLIEAEEFMCGIACEPSGGRHEERIRQRQRNKNVDTTTSPICLDDDRIGGDANAVFPIRSATAKSNFSINGKTASGDNSTNTSNNAPQYSKFAHHMMRKMGHTDGKGLGGRGISSPIKATGMTGWPHNDHGVGFEKKKETLNQRQAQAAELAKNGRNVFVTGPAGTGKSVVLKNIIDHFKEKYKAEGSCWNRFVAVVGPTGTTAIALGGQTIHSFAGCGVPVSAEDFEKCWKKENKTKWRRLKALVFDEISMISGEFFDRLSNVVSRIRGSNDPFGGIQLILCGDFLQLPPIPKKKDAVQDMKNALAEQGKQLDLHMDRGFAFQAKAWKNANFSVVELNEVFRQSNKDFISVLHEIRRGDVSENAVNFLKRCHRPLPRNKLGIEPTILYATNKNVTAENMNNLSLLPDAIRYFEATDDIEVDQGAPPWASQTLRNHRFFNDCIAEKTLGLKVGAQVMLIKNQSQDVEKRKVNGSRGKVIGFSSKSDIDANDDDDALPDEYLISDDDCPKKSDNAGCIYPIVQFLDKSTQVIHPQKFESHLIGLGTCIRETIPLKLAWAVTMHKSQGMTLDFVKVDVQGVFTEAQTYVALSRASDENGLELKHFSRDKVMVDQRALAFYADPNGNFPCWDEPWGEHG